MRPDSAGDGTIEASHQHASGMSAECRGGVYRPATSDRRSVRTQDEARKRVEQRLRGIAPDGVLHPSFHPLLAHQSRGAELVEMVVDGRRRETQDGHELWADHW